MKQMLSLVHVGHNYWHPTIATSFSQGNSSEFSLKMPEEFEEHLIRDQRPCFFSSVHLSLLQGSGQRTGTAMVKD